MQSPLDFFHEHFGSIVDPAATPMEVLMRGYRHSDPSKSVTPRMGGSEPARFLISADIAKVWTPIALPEHTKGRITIATTSERKRRDWMVDVIMDPPEPPFLAVAIGMAAADASFWRPTVSKGTIVFSGAAALFDEGNSAVIDRARFIAAKDWFAETKVHVSDLLRRRDVSERYRLGSITGEAARNQLKKIKTPSEVLDGYPGVKDAFQMKLAYYAANEWVPL